MRNRVGNKDQTVRQISSFRVALVALCIVALPAAADQTSDRERQTTRQAIQCEGYFAGEAFARTELFFGLSKPDGSVVTKDEFQMFLDKEITPRFPDGLTVLMGRGQYRTQSGNIIAEESVIVILLYPFGGEEKRQSIEAIREAYKRAFQQESVLRSDSITCVAF